MMLEKPENIMPKITILRPNISLTGRAIPGDASRDWYPFILKLENFAENWQEINITFEFSYYNTSSSSYITRIMYILDSMRSESKKVIINWKYYYTDEDMQISGEDYSEMFPKLNINLISYK